ncbi:MAG TPA: pyridoxal phosphate-dependent aminotransferase [Nitriliruptorales bacterium]|nr:pyridoxal phosphate-dependent aminotransferase [Nitriliruptorales bacterium]
MGQELSGRVRGIQESVTLAVSQRAKEMRAAGEPVIGLGAGEPDFPAPPHVVEAAQRACADTRLHHYTPAAGLPELRDAIVEATERSSGVAVTREQVVVTNGGKHALYEVFQTLLDPGDEVLLPSPYWVTYPEQIALAGGQPVVVATTAVGGFRTTVEQLEAATTARTKALVFVSPSNPTGAVYPPQEVAAIGRWAASRGIWVVTDEIYQHLVYGEFGFASVPAVAPEVVDRCVIVNGVAKTYAMTGWRVGWLVAPRDVAAAVTRLQSHMTSNVSNVAQVAATAALTGPQDRVAEMRAAFDRRRQLAVAHLRSMDGVVCPEPRGAFYVFPDLTGILGREVGGRTVASSMDLAEVLLDHAKVAVVPGEGFGAPGCLRLSYALSDDDLVEGLQRMGAALAG